MPAEIILKRVFKFYATFVMPMAIFVVLLFPSISHAYIDPMTGNFVLQLLIAAIVGAAVAIKAFWFRIKIFFGRFFSKENENDNQ